MYLRDCVVCVLESSLSVCWATVLCVQGLTYLSCVCVKLWCGTVSVYSCVSVDGVCQRDDVV